MNLVKSQLLTPARIGLERSGRTISTRELLKLKLATAQAHDAVSAAWDVDRLRSELEASNFATILLSSCVQNRSEYLQRPDLGRILSDESRLFLNSSLQAHAAEIAIIVSDGLCSRAIEHHFMPLWQHVATLMAQAEFTRYPMCLVPYSRVAISDEVGSLLGAKLALIFIGERPGLSANDSLSIYFTYNPRVGNCDANRNCISNIHPPDGLGYEEASQKLMYLLTQSFKLQISGVQLKEGFAPIVGKELGRASNS